jgi:pimeloyl-ACP methyl ester carboxylesterase
VTTTAWRRTGLDGRTVRVAVLGTPTERPPIVAVPGLGARNYLLPWLRAMSAWTQVTLLDLPGWWWGRARACPPTIPAVAATVGRWVDAHTDRPVVLLGHSTGAQAAARAVSTGSTPPGRIAGLVLAGPTFVPSARRPGGLAGAAVRTARRETVREVPAVAGSYAHSGGVGVVRMLASGLGDRPEDAVRGLPVSVPLLVLTGAADHLAPPAWAAELAALGGGTHHVLPGAHNGCFRHPEVWSTAVRDGLACTTGCIASATARA